METKPPKCPARSAEDEDVVDTDPPNPDIIADEYEGKRTAPDRKPVPASLAQPAVALARPDGEPAETKRPLRRCSDERSR